MKTFLNKVKDNKAKILKLLSLLLVVALVSLITLGVLMLTGVLYYEDGFQFNSHIFDAFKGKWYGFIVFILVQSLLSILLCVVPGIAAGFVVFSQVLYENAWQAFLLSYSCVILSSTLLYIIGRLGGYKICEKILGKDDCEKSLNLLRTRGTVYFPLMMLFPIFPDDALVMIAGVTKMKLRWFVPSILLCRGVGVATIVFGMSIIPFDSFVSAYDWMILVTIGFFWIKEIFTVANFIDRYFERKRNPEKAVKFTFAIATSKNYLQLYRSLVTIIVSLGISFISFGYITEIYQWMIVITVVFFWVREIFIIADKIHDDIQYTKKMRDAIASGLPIPPRPGSVNTFHSIATVILCGAITLVHFASFDSILKLIILVTLAFFWVREIFKIANKVDGYFNIKRKERNDALIREFEELHKNSK